MTVSNLRTARGFPVDTPWGSILVKALSVGCLIMVFSLSKLFMKGHRNDLESQAAMLVLPVIASLLNTLIPFFFSWLGHLERFQTPGQHIYVTITRYFLLPPLRAFGLKLSDFFLIQSCVWVVWGPVKQMLSQGCHAQLPFCQDNRTMPHLSSQESSC